MCTRPAIYCHSCHTPQSGRTSRRTSCRGTPANIHVPAGGTAPALIPVPRPETHTTRPTHGNPLHGKLLAVQQSSPLPLRQPSPDTEPLPSRQRVLQTLPADRAHSTNLLRLRRRATLFRKPHLRIRLRTQGTLRPGLRIDHAERRRLDPADLCALDPHQAAKRRCHRVISRILADDHRSDLCPTPAAWVLLVRAVERSVIAAMPLQYAACACSRRTSPVSGADGAGNTSTTSPDPVQLAIGRYARIRSDRALPDTRIDTLDAAKRQDPYSLKSNRRSRDRQVDQIGFGEARTGPATTDNPGAPVAPRGDCLFGGRRHVCRRASSCPGSPRPRSCGFNRSATASTKSSVPEVAPGPYRQHEIFESREPSAGRPAYGHQSRARSTATPADGWMSRCMPTRSRNRHRACAVRGGLRAFWLVTHLDRVTLTILPLMLHVLPSARITETRRDG